MSLEILYFTEGGAGEISMVMGRRRNGSLIYHTCCVDCNENSIVILHEFIVYIVSLTRGEPKIKNARRKLHLQSHAST